MSIRIQKQYKFDWMALEIIVGWAEKGLDLGGVEEGNSTVKI